MTTKRILGIIVVVAGIALLFVSGYIKQQVAGGKEKISAAQKKVNQADSLFSLTPATKDIGKGLTGGAQKKIDEAKDTVAYYAKLADQLQVAGFVVLATGVVILFLSRKKKK